MMGRASRPRWWAFDSRDIADVAPSYLDEVTLLCLLAVSDPSRSYLCGLYLERTMEELQIDITCLLKLIEAQTMPAKFVCGEQRGERE